MAQTASFLPLEQHPNPKPPGTLLYDETTTTVEAVSQDMRDNNKTNVSFRLERSNDSMQLLNPPAEDDPAAATTTTTNDDDWMDNSTAALSEGNLALPQTPAAAAALQQYQSQQPSHSSISLYHGSTHGDETHYAVEYGTVEDYQQDESQYDDRASTASLERHRLTFPSDRRLYGRDDELARLQSMSDYLRYSHHVLTDDPTAATAARVVFLGGPSGSGKSSLVQEFVKQQNNKTNNNHRPPVVVWQGKFDQMRARHNTPLSAVAKALNDYFLQFQHSTDTDPHPHHQNDDDDDTSVTTTTTPLDHLTLLLQQRLPKQAGIYPGSDNYQLLVETLVPALKYVWIHDEPRNQSWVQQPVQHRHHSSAPSIALSGGSSTRTDLQRPEEEEGETENYYEDDTTEHTDTPDDRPLKRVAASTASTTSSLGVSSGRPRPVSSAESVGSGSCRTNSSLNNGKQMPHNNNRDSATTQRNSKAIQFAFGQLIKAVASTVSLLEQQQQSQSQQQQPGSSSPVIFFIDDLQWADPQSLHFLKKLMQELLEQTSATSTGPPPPLSHNQNHTTTATEMTKMTSSSRQLNVSLHSAASDHSGLDNDNNNNINLKRYQYVRKLNNNNNNNNISSSNISGPSSTSTPPAKSSAKPCCKILFIAAYRSDEITPQHGFYQVRKDLLEISRNKLKERMILTNQNRHASQPNVMGANNSGGNSSSRRMLRRGSAGANDQRQPRHQRSVRASLQPFRSPPPQQQDIKKNTTGEQLAMVLELSNLDPDSVGQYIADTLTYSSMTPDADSDDDEEIWSVERVIPITQAVYTKTLGNMFGVQQALEALVRKNIIYYDVISFSWTFSSRGMTQVEIQDCLPENILHMVQDKLKLLPRQLQTAMALASYTHETISLDLMFALMLQYSGRHKRMELKAEEEEESKSNLQKPPSWDSPSQEVPLVQLEALMQLANKEGLVLKDALAKNAAAKNTTYRFAHDRIREAARASVPEGEDRDLMLLDICQVLLERSGFMVHRQELLTSKEFNFATPGATEEEEDTNWMLFTSVGHMNSLPPALTDKIQVAELNMAVGKISTSKGAFADALVFFRTAYSQMEESDRWSDSMYAFTLELLNNMTDCERSLSNYESARNHAVEIFRHANKGVADKFRAQSAYISVLYEENREGSLWIEKGLEICESYGITGVPVQPTIANVAKEVLAFKFALKGRSLLKLMEEYPIVSDEFVTAHIAMMNVMIVTAIFANQDYLIAIMAHRQVVAAMKYKVVTKELPVAICVLQHVMAKYQKWKASYGYTTVVAAVLDRFPEHHNESIVLQGSLGLLRGNLYAQLRYREAAEQYFEFNRKFMSKGQSFWGLSGAVSGLSAFFIGSSPLTTLIESKILLLEEMATTFGQEKLLHVYRIHRQFLYNLTGAKGAATSEATLDGDAFREEESVEFCDVDALSDIYYLRLMLAVYYDDSATMQLMLERLDEIEINPLYTGRQNLRLTYTAFACILLGKTSKRKLYSKWGSTANAFWKKLAKAGSVNAQPIQACIEALEEPSIDGFEEAIRICGDARLTNLVALMSERCALWILEFNQMGELPDERCKIPSLKGSSKRSSPPPEGDEYKQYLVQALWNYQSWGALGKVDRLMARFAFLRSAVLEKPPSDSDSEHHFSSGIPSFIG